MTRYTITAVGNVRVDDEAILGIDVPEFPANFNALQFQTDKGHIEYNDGITPNVPITTMDGIEEYLGVDLETLLTRRTAKKAKIAAEIKANLLKVGDDGFRQ